MPWGLKHFQQSGELHFLDRQLTPAELHDSAFARMLRIVSGTRTLVLRVVRERGQICGEADVHPSQSGGARIGGAARGLAMEQLPSLLRGCGRSGRDCVSMNGARKRVGIIPTVCVRTDESPAQAELERGTLKSLGG